MSDKPYELGIIVGRFQILHLGHSEIIKKALELCDTVGILVGSSQESGTMKNPFDYETRRDFLLTAFPKLQVFPLPDIGVGNCRRWGEYVLQNVIDDFGKAPDLFISGDEARRESWFGPETRELYVAKTIDISATKMKQYIINDDKESWNKFIDPAIADRFEEMRKIIISCKDNLSTQSL